MKRKEPAGNSQIMSVYNLSNSFLNIYKLLKCFFFFTFSPVAISKSTSLFASQKFFFTFSSKKTPKTLKICFFSIWWSSTQKDLSKDKSVKIKSKQTEIEKKLYIPSKKTTSSLWRIRVKSKRMLSPIMPKTKKIEEKFYMAWQTLKL